MENDTPCGGAAMENDTPSTAIDTPFMEIDTPFMENDTPGGVNNCPVINNLRHLSTSVNLL